MTLHFLHSDTDTGQRLEIFASNDALLKHKRKMLIDNHVAFDKNGNGRAIEKAWRVFVQHEAHRCDFYHDGPIKVDGIVPE